MGRHRAIVIVAIATAACGRIGYAYGDGAAAARDAAFDSERGTEAGALDGAGAMDGPPPCSPAPCACDPTPRRVSDDAMLLVGRAWLAASPSGYALHWADARDALAPGEADPYLLVLDRLGAPIGAPARLAMAPDGWHAIGGAVAWSGAGYSAVWMEIDGASSGDATYSWTSEAGAPLGTTVLTVSRSTPASVTGTWADGAFSTLWQEDRGRDYEIFVRRLDRTGGAIGPEMRFSAATPGVSSEPTIAWTGSEHGIAWIDSGISGTLGLYFARIDAAGALVSAPTRIADSSSVPRLVWDGLGYGLAWRAVNGAVFEAYFARLDASGAVVTGPLLVSDPGPGLALAPSLAWSGSDYALAWSEDSEGNSDIYVVRIDASGGVGAPSRFTTAGWSREASIAWDGERYAVAWTELDLATKQTELWLAHVCP